MITESERNQPVRAAIIGMGSMGKGLFYQCSITPGIECTAVADIDLTRAIACADAFRREYAVVRTLAEMHAAIERGRLAVCEDGDLLARCERVDVLIESSNSIAAGGKFSITALEHHKHLILMNAEVDLIFGPYLLQLARANGVVYTSCDGDQHGVIKHLVDDLSLWGFDLVMAGNIKGFLDRTANPKTIVPEADKRRLGYKMATAYTDGTKLCIEMALLANALGLSTHTPGMLGPRAHDVHEVFQLFDLPDLWKNRQPLVDYVLGGEPGGGVFAVGYCDNEYQKSMMTYYKMGDGPFYLFYRPYHLCHVEAMRTIMEACLENRPLLQPRHGFRTNVFAYAKRNLRQGEKLDGVGGYTCYGLIENCSPSGLTAPGLPICLAEEVVLKRDVARDERIAMTDLTYDPTRFDLQLFAKAQAIQVPAK